VRLGCGTYSVWLTTKAEIDRRIFEVPWRSIEWARVLDETSQASVTAGAGCCGELFEQEIRPWSHQMAILRAADDGTPFRVWSGPVVGMRAAGELTLRARDLSAWFDRRFLHDPHFFIAADVATIFEAFWDDALAPDPVPQFALSVSPTTVTADREILPEQHRVSAEEMRELGRTGIDWTVVDRTMIAGPEEIDVPPIATLTDEHFAEVPEVEVDGLQQANRIVVTGAGGGAEGDEIVGDAVATPGAEGLLEGVANEPAILDDTSALAAADSRLERQRVPQVIVTGGRLVPEAPVEIDALVPGAQVRVGLSGTCVPVRQTVRLSALRVTAAAGDDGVTEQVSLELQPLGSTLNP
jgi:hypothetical protein